MRLFIGIMGIFLALYGMVASSADWRSASHAPVGLAPDPATTPEAVVQVYGARTWGWKGAFGVHTWVAVKPTNAKAWRVYEVIGWRLRWSDSVVVISDRDPDARWYGSEPQLYADKRGEGVDEVIARIEKAASDYPYAAEYGLWPGPNSNTFTAWLTRAAPELEVDLPATAIGKDYLRDKLIDSPASGHGVQLSLKGLLGVTASSVEGFEVNVLGLSFGFGQSGLKLPFIGRIGGSLPHIAASAIDGTSDKP
jgi:hypothetical protein